MKNGNPISLASPSALKAYFLASRPKTWIASLSPVLIGVCLAPKVRLLTFFLTLLFALGIQIGTNFANDYFDFIKGADAKRIGPKRATQEGWISAPAMLRAALLTFALALLAAGPLIVQAGLWSLFLALLSVLFGILYTGGAKPLGYLGLGELLVFPFFGPIATCGAYFLQTGLFSSSVFVAGIAPGLFSCALLIANNLRDAETDRLAGKWTLVARFGSAFGKAEHLFAALGGALIPFLLVFSCGSPSLFLLASLPLPLAFRATLPSTALLFFLYTVLFCFAAL